MKLAGAVSVSVNSDGYLVTSQNDRWRQVEPLVFAEVDGKRHSPPSARAGWAKSGSCDRDSAYVQPACMR